mgnify:CR=1 FL=1
MAGARPVHPEAHDAYLKGSFYWNRLTAEDLDTAQSYFELALENLKIIEERDLVANAAERGAELQAGLPSLEKTLLVPLLEDNPALGLSLYRRNPYLDPLNNIQITLLSRYRNSDLTDEQRERWLHPLLRTINAIAGGMRNTG